MIMIASRGGISISISMKNEYRSYILLLLTTTTTTTTITITIYYIHNTQLLCQGGVMAINMAFVLCCMVVKKYKNDK
jgi:hypothetical protein